LPAKRPARTLKGSQMFYLSLIRHWRIPNGPNKGLIGPLLGTVIRCRTSLA